MDEVIVNVQKTGEWLDEDVETMNQAKYFMTEFYSSEFAQAKSKEHSHFLLSIFEQRRHEHLAMYTTVLQGIRKDPLYSRFIGRVENLVDNVENRFDKDNVTTRRRVAFHKSHDPGAYGAAVGSKGNVRRGRLCPQAARYITLGGVASGHMAGESCICVLFNCS
jgi:hypothetical protein